MVWKISQRPQGRACPRQRLSGAPVQGVTFALPEARAQVDRDIAWAIRQTSQTDRNGHIGRIAAGREARDTLTGAPTGSLRISSAGLCRRPVQGVYACRVRRKSAVPRVRRSIWHETAIYPRLTLQQSMSQRTVIARRPDGALRVAIA